MAKMYELRMVVSADQFMALYKHFGRGIEPTIQEIEVESGHGNQIPTKSMRAPRKPRGSKVEDTIRSALNGGPRTTKELKEALEHVGLSSGSLAVGIANMKKRGEVERSVDGTYDFPSLDKAAE